MRGSRKNEAFSTKRTLSHNNVLYNKKPYADLQEKKRKTRQENEKKRREIKVQIINAEYHLRILNEFSDFVAKDTLQEMTWVPKAVEIFFKESCKSFAPEGYSEQISENLAKTFIEQFKYVTIINNYAPPMMKLFEHASQEEKIDFIKTHQKMEEKHLASLQNKLSEYKDF